MRSSDRKVLDHPVKSASELPLWNFDGSSTGQAPGHDSEVIIKLLVSLHLTLMIFQVTIMSSTGPSASSLTHSEAATTFWCSVSATSLKAMA